MNQRLLGCAVQLNYGRTVLTFLWKIICYPLSQNVVIFLYIYQKVYIVSLYVTLPYILENALWRPFRMES